MEKIVEIITTKKKIMIKGENSIIISKSINKDLAALTVETGESFNDYPVYITGFTVYGGDTYREKVEYLILCLGYNKYLAKFINFLLLIFDLRTYKL